MQPMQEVFVVRVLTVAAVIAVLVVLGAPAAFAQGWDTSDLWLPERVREMPTQSWFGATGMMVIPTATVLDHTRVSAHGHYIKLGETDEWESVYGVNAAIYPGLEGGLTFLSQALAGLDSNQTLIQAKYAIDLAELLNAGPEAPALAIGGRDLANNINRTYYIVATKEFLIDEVEDTRCSLTLGVGNSDESGAPLDGFFIGVDFSPFDFARLQLEHDNQNFNAQLRYWFSEWAVVEVGFLDGDLGAGMSIYTGF